MSTNHSSSEVVPPLPQSWSRRLPRCVNVSAFALVAVWLGAAAANAQILQTVFSDDFSSNTIDPGKYQPDAPFFEGGTGDIHAEAGGGVLHFVGTTSQQWWSGGTLRLVPTFTASEQANLVVSVDRVAEQGMGSASRSALWILDESQQNYVLFADVRGEGGWHYNRKIGETGDVPTGGGTDIAAFNGGTFDDGGLHRMKVVADGATVKLYVDNQFGTEVKFPFSKIIVHLGAYARANTDTADTTFDNLNIEVARQTTTVFSDDFSSNTIDPGKYQADAPFFEGGLGDIHAVPGNGVLQFVGSTTQQWWSGATLRIVPTFKATEDTIVAASVDRVAEQGVGSAARSAFWILDASQQNYVLFADVRGEGGWHYNRKIGETGDVPTGGGVDIAAFNGGTFDDQGLHRMKIVADGKTVKLYVDDIFGVEVKFPFSDVIFHVGSYARANNDTADTTFDNLVIETTSSENVIFADDFSSNTITNLLKPDAPFFEGGLGDIHAEAGGGVIHFVGSTTQQWWSGATLRFDGILTATEEAPITLSIDRVAEQGVGSASRSALWVLDEAGQNYVLFADVRGEGGWHFNRKIGEAGDVPTGGGTDIAAFNGETFDDGGLHQMKMVVNGTTAQLFLDGQFGTEVRFPFRRVQFQFGSYARANNDTADTTWDNLRIVQAVGGGVEFSPDLASVRPGQSSDLITLTLAEGLNAVNAVTVRVVSSNPTVAVPEGGTGGGLDITFPARGANTATFRVRGLATGSARFTVDGDIPSLNELTAVVAGDPGLSLSDDFEAPGLDTAKWQVSTRPFETGTGGFDVEQTGGLLRIVGAALTDFWPGASIASKQTFTATKDLNLVVEVDRLSLDRSRADGALPIVRSGVFLTSANHSNYFFFSHNWGESGWTVNITDNGTGTGIGTSITNFNDADDGFTHRIKLVFDGEAVDVFLDERPGGRFPFALNADILVEIAAFARSTGDNVDAQFDNLSVSYQLPCATIGPVEGVSITHKMTASATVAVPRFLNDRTNVPIAVVSRDPSIAVPNGAPSGVLFLDFAAGTPNTRLITVNPTGLGSTTFDITSSVAGLCLSGSLPVEIVAAPKVCLSDSFEEIDSAVWRRDETPFENGTLAPPPASDITLTNGQVKIEARAATASYPGLALFTVDTYSASPTMPTSFEIDRVRMEFVLIRGDVSEQRTGIWIREPGGNFVFFADDLTHNGRNYGWRVNMMTGDAADVPTGVGVNIPAFDGSAFDNRGLHRMRLVANGSTVKIFLDGILGYTVPFPFSDGLTFGFGSYPEGADDVVRGYFDNALITCGAGSELFVRRDGGNVIISWTGTGTLQSSATLEADSWQNVTPAPVGNTLTVSLSEGPQKFYRLQE